MMIFVQNILFYTQNDFIFIEITMKILYRWQLIKFYVELRLIKANRFAKNTAKDIA